MKLVPLFLALSLFLSSCVGVDGQPLYESVQNEYDEQFIKGCMGAIWVLTSPERLPSFNEAIAVCEYVKQTIDEYEAEEESCEEGCL